MFVCSVGSCVGLVRGSSLVVRFAEMFEKHAEKPVQSIKEKSVGYKRKTMSSTATLPPIDGDINFYFSRFNPQTGYNYDCDCGRLKGSFDGRVLDLGFERYQVAEIAAIRFYTGATIGIIPSSCSRPAAFISSKQKIVQKLTKNINMLISKLRADRKSSQLLSKGSRDFRSVVCPHCSSTVDLSGFDVSPQVFCMYCFSLFQPRSPNPTAAAAGMDICDICGLFDSVRWYTFSADDAMSKYDIDTKLLCQSCLQTRARRMLILGMIGVITLPYAVWHHRRTMKPPEMPPNLENLKHANTLVLSKRPRKIQQGQEIYRNILAVTGCQAGIRTNMALCDIQKNDLRGAVVALEAALRDCSNYEPAANLLMECYCRIGGNEEEMKELRSKFAV